MKKLVLGMFVLCLMASLALAQTDKATGTVTNDATMARLRLGHFVYGGPNVDWYVDGQVAVNGGQPQVDIPVGYVSGYLYLEPGSYRVAVVPTGEKLAQALIGPLDMSLEAGHRYTLAMMGQPEDESLTPLVLDETAILQESRTDPNQFTMIFVNNVAGTTTISFDDKRGGPRDVSYGGFGVASYANDDGRVCGDFVITFDGTEIVNEPKPGECEPVEPGMDFIVAMLGRFPGEDFGDTQSSNTSDLNALEFLQGFSSVGYEQDGHEFSFSTFLAAMDTAGLTEMLETGGPYLMFAPTDEAFAALPEGQLDALMADPEALADVLRYHIFEGYYPPGSVSDRFNAPDSTLKNMLGADLKISNSDTRYTRVDGVNVGDIQFYTVTNGTRVRPVPTLLQPPPEVCSKEPAQANASPRPLTDSIVGMWLFDEGEGDTAGDASGHNHNGTFVNAAWAEGKFGSAARITPGENYIEVETTDESLSPAKEMTVTAWVYLEALPDLEERYPNRRILEASTYDPAEFYYGGGDDHYGLHFQRGSFIFRPGPNADPDRVGIAQSEAVEPGGWHHVAGVYSGDHIRLYIDGTLVSEVEANCRTLVQPRNNRLFIGTKAPEAPEGDYWDGLLDEVAIFDVALTKEEIGIVMQGLGAMRTD